VAQGLTERLAGRPATSGIANSKFSGFFCPEFHPQRLANSRRTEASLAKSLISQMGSFQLERLSTIDVGCCWMSAKSELSSLKSELAVKVLPGLAGRPLPGGQRASILA